MKVYSTHRTRSRYTDGPQNCCATHTLTRARENKHKHTYSQTHARTHTAQSNYQLPYLGLVEVNLLQLVAVLRSTTFLEHGTRNCQLVESERMNLLFCRCCFLLLSIHQIDLHRDLVDTPTSTTQGLREVEMEHPIELWRSTAVAGV